MAREAALDTLLRANITSFPRPSCRPPQPNTMSFWSHSFRLAGESGHRRSTLASPSRRPTSVDDFQWLPAVEWPLLPSGATNTRRWDIDNSTRTHTHTQRAGRKSGRTTILGRAQAGGDEPNISVRLFVLLSGGFDANLTPRRCYCTIRVSSFTTITFLLNNKHVYM